MSNEAVPDISLTEGKAADTTPDSSPYRPRRPPAVNRLPSGSGKWLSKKNVASPSSLPEGSSPFQLHSPPPLVKLPVRRKLFPNLEDDPKGEKYPEILGKRYAV